MSSAGSGGTHATRRRKTTRGLALLAAVALWGVVGTALVKKAVSSDEPSAPNPTVAATTATTTPPTTTRPPSSAPTTATPTTPTSLPAGPVTFSDDFSGTGLSKNWGVYAGRSRTESNVFWSADRLRVADGQLILSAAGHDGRWTAGGVANRKHTQKYGRWQVRFRAQPSDDVAIRFALIPDSGIWPPEITFFTNLGGDRQSASTQLQWRVGDVKKTKNYDLPATDFTTWHTVGVDWRKGKLTFLLDGKPWQTITGAAVPSSPLKLVLESSAGACERAALKAKATCPKVGTPNPTRVWIDKVSIRR